MKAIIRTVYFDGEPVYQVVENPNTRDASVEYTSGDMGCAEKFCEKHYGTDWGEE